MAEVKFEHYRYHHSGKKGIFDKIPTSEFYPFEFLKFEPPRDPRLINSGAVAVVMSFKNRKKILHTGIIEINPNIFIGNNLKENGKKDFIIIYHNKPIIHFFLFKNKNPRNKTEFALKIISYLKEQKLT